MKKIEIIIEPPYHHDNPNVFRVLLHEFDNNSFYQKGVGGFHFNSDLQDMLTKTADAKMYGEVLGRALFHGIIGQAWLHAWQTEGVRVQLVIKPSLLLSIHWERLCVPLDPSYKEWGFLRLYQQTPFAFQLVSHKKTIPKPTRQDLNTLVCVASPLPDNKYGLSSFDTNKMIQPIKKSLPNGLTILSTNSNNLPTIDALMLQLTKKQYHILHLITHGGFTYKNEEMLLYLVDDKKQVKAIKASEFVERLKMLHISRIPSFVFLSACDGAQSLTDVQNSYLWQGLAQLLVMEVGVSAVVAMTSQISISTVAELVPPFYEQLTLHGQIDKALVESCAGSIGRNDILIPMLYVRSGGEYLYREHTVSLYPPTLQPYLEWVSHTYNSIPLTALDPARGDESSLALSEVFVGLMVNGLSNNSEGVHIQTHDKHPSVLEYIHNHEQLILLGDPGSGKSTILRFLAYCLTQALLNPNKQWLTKLAWASQNKQVSSWQITGLVPIIINLSHLDITTLTENGDIRLWQWVNKHLKKAGLTKETRKALQILAQEKGKVIWLLDGVDEVPFNQRKFVWSMIKQLNSSIYGQGRWVTTCRILSFNKNEAPPVMRQEILPFNTQQQYLFVKKWYRALVVNGEIEELAADAKIESLQNVLTTQVGTLATNPMLLTIIALVHTYYGELPTERARLYATCVETMLLRWQKQRGLPSILIELEIEQRDLERLLWEIAWIAHENKTDAKGYLSREQVLKVSEKHLGNSFRKATAFIEYTEKRAHLLLGIGGDKELMYTFPHRTFQEYLAACYLTTPRLLRGKKLAQLAGEGDKWREVLNLVAGILVYNKNEWERVIDLVADILPSSPPRVKDIAGWNKIWIGSEMARVVGWEQLKIDKEMGADVIIKLQKLLTMLVKKGRLLPKQRLIAGDILAEIGDKRIGVSYFLNNHNLKVPDIAWGKWIKLGEYEVGNYNNSSHSNKVSIDKDYRLSSYLVTYSQFQCFVEAPDLHNKQWWIDIPQDNRYLSLRNAEWAIDNRPREMVSWYQAIAFCRWLSDKLQYEVSLPHEYEWEIAAKWGHQGSYSWRGNWDVTKGNINEELGQTSTVGMYPYGRQTKLNLYDMTGNVDEWCSNSHQNVHHTVIDSSPRVVRGGSWFNSKYDARVTSRNYYYPYICYNNIGFRLISYR